MFERLSNAVEWLSSGMQDPAVGTIIVGTVLSVAVLSAVLVYLLGEWGDRRQRKRELKGLLRILDMEIAGNERLLRIFDEHPTWISRAPDQSLQTRAWEDTRVELAHLLKNDEQFNDIADYYENIQAVERYRLIDTGAETSEEHRQHSVKRQLHLLLEMSDVAKGHIRKHVPDTLVGTPLRRLEEGDAPEPVPPHARRTERRTSNPRWRRLFG
jgi:hypothetical protein